MSGVPSKDQCHPKNLYVHHKKMQFLDKREVTKYTLGLTLKYMHQVSTPNPDVILPEDIVLGVAAALRTEINKALESFLDIASGKELTKFLAVWETRNYG
uniref:24 kDa seed maturation protein n=1 Tax=Solanum tuberosum TaxID=4113 RepID=M1CAI7_SOLTU